MQIIHQSQRVRKSLLGGFALILRHIPRPGSAELEYSRRLRILNLKSGIRNFKRWSELPTVADCPGRPHSREVFAGQFQN